ncbi:hypothetical protein [Brevibacillus porteri]|uniref:hypothetical protein n=1 Tax=Brevibacillus porteri TaxID=2126350 RepID=UPI003D2208BA
MRSAFKEFLTGIVPVILLVVFLVVCGLVTAYALSAVLGVDIGFAKGFGVVSLVYVIGAVCRAGTSSISTP